MATDEDELDYIPGEEETEQDRQEQEQQEQEEVVEQVSDIIDEASSDTSYEDLTQLTEAVYNNPLNPKTRENLQSFDEVKKTLGKHARPSSTTGKRWISLQAYNHNAVNDGNWDPANIETGLVVTTTKKPGNGSGWDEVVEVKDITNYNPSQYQGGTPPTDPLKHWTTSTSTHFTLHYKFSAHQKTSGASNTAMTHGLERLDFEVIFASGHIETFNIPCPIGKRYSQQYSYIGGGIQASVIESEVVRCEFKTATEFYSKGANSITSYNYLTSNYGVLTRYKALNNPSGTLQNLGLYKYYDNSGVANPTYNLVNSMSRWTDPLALEFGPNGVVTPDQNETAKQVLLRLDVVAQENTTSTHPFIDNKDHNWFTTNFSIPSNIASNNTWVDNVYTGAASDTSYDQLVTSIETNNSRQQYFTSTVYYSENIESCTVSPTTTYNVCDSIGNPSYYLTTSKDCSGSTIPAADLPGGSNYLNVVYNHNPGCCTACTLSLHTNTIQASYNTSNGIVRWDVRDPITNAATGDPWGSGGMYTVTITNSSGAAVGTAAPAGSAVFTDNTCDTNTTTGTAHLVTCDSNVKIVPGMQVSGTGIPASTYVGAITSGTVGIDVTQFSLVDAIGGVVSATQVNTNVTLTFATGMYGQHGGLAPTDASNPYYTLCITDESNCQECTNFTITEKAAVYGCTDNTAINYNSSATFDNGSCILCSATDGLLHDPIGVSSTPLFDTLQAAGTAATWGGSSHNTDGTLAVSAAPVASAVPYMEWDANSSFELKLYKTVNPGDSSTATGATLIATQSAGTLNNVSVAAHLFTGLAHGYYTVRVRYIDSNTVSTLENCWTEWFGVVQAEVCDDPTNPSYTATPADIALRWPTPSLCSQVIACCTLSILYEDTTNRGSKCSPILYSNLNCDPGRNVDVEWLYSATGASYTSIGTYNVGIQGNTTLLATAGNISNGTNWYLQHGNGYYKVKITGTTLAGHVCIEETYDNFTLPLSGCMDPNALNYDAAAICPGPCTYPSWDCANGQCIDPGTGNGQYLTLADCQSNCAPIPIPGCTDSCATNYNPAASLDDGSCTYTACMDPAATNIQMNCCLQQIIPQASIIASDPSCCILPCAIPPVVTPTTTNSTGTCTTFNSDGSINLNVMLPNGAITWTWEIRNNTGTTIIYTDPTTYSAGDTSNTYSTLMYGNYTYKVTDNTGCVYEDAFTINSSSANVGCTDPAADNYDPSAVCDCCCIISGCMDPNAGNYNPNATTPGQCDYPPVPPNPCVPDNVEDILTIAKGCLTLKGTEWLNKYKTGRADDCTLLNKWKLILIDYLLDQENLDCLFNCAHQAAPPTSGAADCNSLWVTGGLSTGENHDPNHMGTSVPPTGEGTTVTAYDDYPNGWFGYQNPADPTNPVVNHYMYSGPARSNLTYVGDYIKFDLPTGHPLASQLNGTIWQLTTLPPATNTWNTNGGHQGCKNQKISHYTQCLDHIHTVSVTTTTNYYDKFLNFVNKFCADCGISTLNDNNNTLI